MCVDTLRRVWSMECRVDGSIVSSGWVGRVVGWGRSWGRGAGGTTQARSNGRTVERSSVSFTCCR